MPVASPPNTAVCAECGHLLPSDCLIRHGNLCVCAACKPIFLQKLAEGRQVDPQEVCYAGFWIRLLARLIDGAFEVPGFSFLSLLTFAILYPTPDSAETIHEQTMQVGLRFLAAQSFSFLLLFGYEVLMVAWFGATFGKMACRLRVVRADGGRVSLRRALGRCLAVGINSMTFGLGFIVAGWDREKRALHDHLCGTRVIHR